MKILLAGKRELLREGLARLLADHPSVDLVTCVVFGEIVEKAKAIQPDVVVIGSEGGDDYMNGIRLAFKSAPNTRVLLFHHSDEEIDFWSAVRAGVRGFVSKDATVDEFIKAIDIVAEGGVIITPALAATIFLELVPIRVNGKKSIAQHGLTLSEREWHVLNMVAQGATNKDIASKLFISENTVKVHLHNIFAKLQVHTRTQAALLAHNEQFDKKA